MLFWTLLVLLTPNTTVNCAITYINSGIKKNLFYITGWNHWTIQAYIYMRCTVWHLTNVDRVQ